MQESFGIVAGAGRLMLFRRPYCYVPLKPLWCKIVNVSGLGSRRRGKVGPERYLMKPGRREGARGGDVLSVVRQAVSGGAEWLMTK